MGCFCAALHPPLCNLPLAVGRNRGGLATSLLLLWWEKRWQKENVHLPSTASCRLWASLFIQQKGLLCSWPSQWCREWCILKYIHIFPSHFSVQEYCTTTQIVSAAVVPSAIWEKTGALKHRGKAAVRTFSSLGITPAWMCPGSRCRPWLIRDAESITTPATPPPLHSPQ